jgi:hypothetical protein
MTKELLQYHTAMAVFRGWCAKGIISAADLQVLERRMAEKYGLSLSSIYREIA